MTSEDWSQSKAKSFSSTSKLNNDQMSKYGSNKCKSIWLIPSKERCVKELIKFYKLIYIQQQHLKNGYFLEMLRLLQLYLK